MTTRKQVKLVQEGEYVAEVEVELIESEEGWAPYLSLQDVHKLDAVREALRDGILAAAMKAARAVVSVQPEGLEQHSPGQRPGDS